MKKNLSLVNGTKWYWRQGLREVPMHSYSRDNNFTPTKELYLAVQSPAHAKKLQEELQLNGIQTETKKTRSPYDAVPKGSLIVFAPLSFVLKSSEEEKNIKKLKDYVLSNGGIIVENVPQPSSVKSFILNLFKRGRK